MEAESRKEEERGAEEGADEGVLMLPACGGS